MLRTATRELPEFVGQHRWFDTALLVRGLPRLHRLASAHAGCSGGEPVATPLLLKGRRLELNCSIDAAGSVFLRIQHATGEAIPESALEQAPEPCGDGIEEAFRRRHGSDVSVLERKRVRLRFGLKDRALYLHRSAEQHRQPGIATRVVRST